MAIATLEIHNRLSDTCMEPRKVKTPKPPRSITVNRQFGDGQVEVVLKGSARKEIPFELDDNTGLWRIANTRTKPNLFMAIGLESDKYREELLGEYIQLMATYGEKSTIIIADELLTLNGNIFGLDTPVRPTIEEKEKLVKRLIEDVGDPDRMGIMLWSDISHHSRSKIIRSAVREVYRTEEMKIESGRTIRHKHTPLECDLQDCVYGNMKTRVAAHAKQVGRNQFEIDFQKMVDYVIAEVSGILCLIQGNIPSKISYPIKVGPTTEAWFDSIVYRLLQGVYSQDIQEAKDQEIIEHGHSEELDRIRLEIINKIGRHGFGSIYLSFKNE